MKKSSARIPCAWDRRNSAQPGPSRCGARSIPALLRICQTVDGATVHRCTTTLTLKNDPSATDVHVHVTRGGPCGRPKLP